MGAGRKFNDGQEIVLEDFNAITSVIQRELYQRLLYQLVQRQENAFFGDSFLVGYSAANSVIVKKGLGFYTDGTQTTPESTIRPLNLNADTTLTLATPSASLPRIDIVCAQPGVASELTATRNYKDASSGSVSPQTLTIQTDWVASLQIVQGTPNASPVAPSVPTGWIKIATLQVAAVSGLAGTGSVADNRALMPIGSLGTVNSTAFVRLTQGAAVSVAQLLQDADTLLKFGYFNYFDLDQLDTSLSLSAPASPAANKQRMYYRDGVLYLKNSTGTITPVGSGGGGGGSIRWNGPQGFAPIEDEENGDRVWLFENTFGQKIVSFIRVPSSFIAGRPVRLNIAAYSPATANAWKLQASAYLIRQNLDGVDSVTNVNITNTGDLTNTVTNQMRAVSLLLSSTTGTINSVAVSAGDLLRVELTRIAATGAEDTFDVRVLPNSTEVTFT